MCLLLGFYKSSGTTPAAGPQVPQLCPGCAPCMQALQGQERQERLEDRSHVAQEFTKLRGEVQTLNSGLASQLQASLDSLRTAQQSQERQMAQGMEELKALIVSSHAKKQRAALDDL